MQNTTTPPATVSSDFDELLTPKEVCALLKIDRCTFERWKRIKWLTVLKAPIGRKVYVRKSELIAKYPKDFVNV